eukprot:CAMPEP_0116942866 /NCGR_PEP_ID=MMETSP0467-20121206/34841_1 /TAXON_ID=283647 /ORGANISM="Mesodinium pulex, Strain SPMC105" /LENGTH=76 /DNA_ID=CAMNT_0004625927 /DNA_START=268 /DNA_END=499 /DNA_ORIENTATION=-
MKNKEKQLQQYRKEQKISKFETTMKDYAIKTFMIEDDQINKNEKNCIKRENVDKKNISQWAEQIKQKEDNMKPNLE